MTGKGQRIAYVAGPIDAVAAHKRWQHKQTDESYFGTVYLEQFMQLCAERDYRLFVVTHLATPESRERIGNHEFFNLPFSENEKGVKYHLSCLAWWLQVIVALIRYRPKVVVATAHANYWFMLCILKLFGVRLVSSIHCTLWPKYGVLRRSARALRFINAIYYKFCASAFMVVSADIKDQLTSYYKIRPDLISEFLPTYDRRQFECLEPASFEKRPFEILFCGRIEENKGVFDVLKIAKSLMSSREPQSFMFHICGEGGELDGVRKLVKSERLGEIVTVHGYCGVKDITALIKTSHMFIVPTRTSFEEGFNKVCAEGVISLRPVISSSVCPAMAYLKGATLSVTPDNWEAYRDAIVQIAASKEEYDETVMACYGAREKFFDFQNGYGARLGLVLAQLVGN